MLMAQHLIGFGVGGDPLIFEYLQSSAEIESADGVTTFSSQNIGSAASGRYIFCVITISAGGSPVTSLDSATIGGVSSTIHVFNTSTSNAAAIIHSLVPSGTTADIILNTTGGDAFAIAHVYRVTGLISTTAFDTDLDDDDVVSMSLNIPAGGFALGGASFLETDPRTTVGVTENYDSSFHVSGSASDLAAETGRTISFDPGGPGDAAGVCASFR